MSCIQPKQLSNRELLARLGQLVQRERVGLTELLAHLAEVDARKFYLPTTTYQKLQEARALMRHQLPDGDLAALMDHALTLLIKDVKERRFAQSKGPRRSAVKTRDTLPSRHIPAEVRRRVAERDRARCTYVDANGRRCGAREFLEFHHRDPWARDRHHDADRITLLCRADNQRAAEHDYGRAFIEEKQRNLQLPPGAVEQ